MMLSSKPTSRSPTAVASGSTRPAAPPTAQPLSCESGEVIVSTRETSSSIAASVSSGSRCDFQ
jgi:hypothetical protein